MGRYKSIAFLSMWIRMCILESIEGSVLYSFKHALPTFISLTAMLRTNDHHERVSASCIYRSSSCMERCSIRQRFGFCKYKMSGKSQEVDVILNKIYDWSGYSKIGGDGYCTSPQEDSRIEATSGPLAFEYGEITPRGMRTLASAVDLTPSDAFFDLGSGVCLS
jgi:hypothetical protein